MTWTPRPPALPLSPAQVLAVAVAHVDRRATRPEAAGIDRNTWIVAVVGWHDALPEDRPWRQRRWIPTSAMRAAAALEADWNDERTPEEVAAEQRRHAAQSALAALEQLQLAGLVSSSERDLVLATLADDLEVA